MANTANTTITAIFRNPASLTEFEIENHITSDHTYCTHDLVINWLENSAHLDERTRLNNKVNLWLEDSEKSVLYPFILNLCIYFNLNKSIVDIAINVLFNFLKSLVFF